MAPRDGRERSTMEGASQRGEGALLKGMFIWRPGGACLGEERVWAVRLSWVPNRIRAGDLRHEKGLLEFRQASGIISWRRCRNRRE